MVPNGWSQKTLEDLSIVERGKFSARPRNDPRYFGGEMPFVQTGDVTGSKTYLNSFTQTLNQDGIGVSKVFPKGTILITIAANIGDTAITSFDVACPDSVVAIQPYSTKADTYWLKNVLDTKKEDLDSQSTQNAQKNINLQVLKPLVILTPPLSEQKKIAKILSTWDKAISTTEQLLANSQQQKMALMQQLLTGKKRVGIPDKSYEFQKNRYGTIPKDWEYPAIKDICTQVTQKNTVSADYPVLSCSKYDGFVDSLKYFKKKVYSDDTSGYRLIHRGCFGFPSNHVEEGSIGLQNLYETGIVSPIYVVFRAKTKRVDNDYLYAVLKTDHYRQIFGAATNASVDRRGSLRWKEFSLIHVPLPPLDEQQKIAAVLSTADKEITTLQQKLDALKQEKKALMQQLLTGKRRVKVEEAA